LVAEWMRVGFIHGVMNTDNTAISGETIDFGPCAFMDAYDPATVFSSIDSYGRYAYGKQPAMAQWNMARFAETILALIDSDTQRAVDIATPVVDSFREHYESHWIAGLRRKIGLVTSEEGDLALVGALLDLMQRAGADFTLTFRRLCDAAGGADVGADAGAHADEVLGAAPPVEFAQWVQGWRSRLARDPQLPADRARAMRTANPAYIPRNHRVEAAIAAATEHADFGPFNEMLEVWSRPYEDQPGRESYVMPPLPAERVLQTFCGT
jgi:uncharacterized protein YdiU (UPF0061 family)